MPRVSVLRGSGKRRGSSVPAGSLHLGAHQQAARACCWPASASPLLLVTHRDSCLDLPEIFASHRDRRYFTSQLLVLETLDFKSTAKVSINEREAFSIQSANLTAIHSFHQFFLWCLILPFLRAQYQVYWPVSQSSRFLHKTKTKLCGREYMQSPEDLQTRIEGASAVSFCLSHLPETQVHPTPPNTTLGSVSYTREAFPTSSLQLSLLENHQCLNTMSTGSFSNWSLPWHIYAFMISFNYPFKCMNWTSQKTPLRITEIRPVFWATRTISSISVSTATLIILHSKNSKFSSLPSLKWPMSVVNHVKSRIFHHLYRNEITFYKFI